MRARTDLPTPVIGIAGWKNSGKTTLVVKLVAEFRRRGLRVATVKHAHHDFEIDEAETDSARHRRAGAAQVAIVSSKRWALVTELGSALEPTLDETIARLEPADLVIVEGYKASPIPKIEVRRQAAPAKRALAADDPHVIAVAADHAVTGQDIPVLHIDDVAVIADFIAKFFVLGAKPAVPVAKKS